MSSKQLKMACYAAAALMIPSLGMSIPPARDPLPAADLAGVPRPVQALKYAKSVLLVRRALQDNQIHSYVKEIWRTDPDAAALPPVGAEYGSPSPYSPQARFPERDAIVFDFGAVRPAGLPNIWRIPVDEKRRVPAFLEEVPVLDNEGTVKRMAEEPMHVDDVRSAVKNTKPEKTGHAS